VTLDTTPSAEEILIRDEEIAAFRKKLAEALAQLPEETQHCLLLRKRDLSYDEIARKLGCTSQSARTRVSRASKLLLERVGPPPGGVKWMEISEGEDDDDSQ
jgi:RNA polymerase sigma factor (sigma-70 family)